LADGSRVGLWGFGLWGFGALELWGFGALGLWGKSRQHGSAVRVPDHAATGMPQAKPAVRVARTRENAR